MKHPLQDIDIEDYWNPDTDTLDVRKIKVSCPSCNREFAALCSKYTEQTWSGWEWVGFSHKEPVTYHKTKCRKCQKEFKFKTRVSQ